VRFAGTIAFIMLCAASPASANKASNPAFLGVGMEDLSGTRGAGPCTITSIEPGSGAEAASLQPGDIFERLDGTPIPSCDALVSQITARTPGTIIHLEIRRRAQALKLKAELRTRDEILRRRLVGQPLPPTELLRVEDGTPMDLGAVKRTTIVGWFPTSCAGCDGVLGAVARWSRERERKDRRAPIDVLAATADLSGRQTAAEIREQLKPAQRTLEVPLLATDHEIYGRFAMRDVDRVHFMVIDCRGVVQYVAPIVPNTDDTSAVLDELYAAAEQTARRMFR
jgi:membrane-associated protease RseP (regulator of RpoE activity)